MEDNLNNKKTKSNLQPYILSVLFFLTFLVGIFLAIKEDKQSKKNTTTPIGTFNTSQFNPFIPSIRVININGIIEYNAMLPYIKSRLKQAEKSDNIKAVILNINSGGGTVGSSQEIYHRIIKFKRETNKPVVAVFGDVAASGAYYIACASDHIIAREGTITGSIGVIIGGFTFEEMFKNLGIKQEIIKSGKFKDLGASIGRSKTKEEKQLLQDVIDSTYQQFFNTVLEARKEQITKANLKIYADGRIFNGENAKEIGLIDEIGGINEAREYIKNKLGISKEINLIEDGPLNFLEKLVGAHYKANYSIESFFKNYSHGTPLYLYINTNN